MAKFAVPRVDAQGQYDVRGGALWRVRINAGQRGRIVLQAGGDLDVTSNTAQVVPNDDSVFVVTKLPDGSRVVEFFGLDAGTSMIEARDASGDVATYVQVQVADIGAKHAFFQLAQPSMALNAANSPVRYEMKYSNRVTAGTSASEIIDSVSSKSTCDTSSSAATARVTPANGPTWLSDLVFALTTTPSSSARCTAW